MQPLERGTIASTAAVSDGATIGAGVTIGPFAVLLDGVELGDGVTVGSHCILGEPTTGFYSGDGGGGSCVVGAGSIIRSHTVVYAGASLGAGTRTGHHVTIREGCSIGDDVQIGTNCDLQGDLSIGDHVRLHSGVFVAQGTVIEDFVWLFPSVVLTNDPHPPSDTCTQGPTIRRYAAVGAGATIMPGVEVGEHALIGSGSLVTRDVGAELLALGVPARVVGSVREVECRHGHLDAVYPWPRQFRRGYPDGVLPEPAAFDADPAS